MVSDITFEAENIEDALEQLGVYFNSIGYDTYAYSQPTLIRSGEIKISEDCYVDKK